MNKLFSDVRVLIWDFDATLFPPNKELARDIIESDYRVVMQHNGWSREKTVVEFEKVFMVITPSSTKTAAILANIPVAQAAVECEQYKDRTKYLHRDEKLIELFHKLIKYKHFILANGMKKKIVESLLVLGLSENQFAEIVTSEIVGVNKPEPKGFLYIVEKTGLPTAAHMMVGDREVVDLVPAKTLGMHTCLVWSDKKSIIADITLETVYEVANVIM